MKILLQAMRNVKKEAVVCSDANSPAFSMGTESVKRGYVDFKKRGVRIRQIVEITKDNLEYCKEFMNYAELRHMDNVKGNMAVSETEYVATAVLEGAKPITQTIYSNVKTFLEQQRYFFENLWSRAMPAEQRIKEIEQNIEPQQIVIIHDAKQALEIYQSLILSAQQEIRIAFPTARAVIRQEKAGIIHLLNKAAERRCRVKILMPNDESVFKFIRKGDANTETRLVAQKDLGKATILVVDNKESLIMELKDDDKETFQEAIGFSIRSNSRPGVLSYVSMFEGLWKQTELYEKMKASDRMKSEFINIAAHEIRTPVQPILGRAEILKEEIESGNYDMESVREAVEMIIRNSQRLHRLTEDLLTVSRIERNVLILNRHDFDLNSVIDNAINDIKNQLQIITKDITILYQPKEKIIVNADKDKITQVIHNLLNNAIKFTDRGTVTIMVEKENKDGSTLFKIRDTGIGIDASLFPRLFQIFATNTIGTSFNQSGSGVGLYISKNIIEAHGGRIWAENNEDGKGATFTFMLPSVKPNR